MAPLLRPLIAVPALGAALYGAAIAWLWMRQERLLFEPDPLPPGRDPLFTDPDVHEFAVDVPGARLSVAQLKRPDPRGVVFYLHGNSGNLRKWFVGLDAFRELDFDLVMMDYRGYGRSSGRIRAKPSCAPTCGRSGTPSPRSTKGAASSFPASRLARRWPPDWPRSCPRRAGRPT